MKTWLYNPKVGRYLAVALIVAVTMFPRLAEAQGCMAVTYGCVFESDNTSAGEEGAYIMAEFILAIALVGFMLWALVNGYGGWLQW